MGYSEEGKRVRKQIIDKGVTQAQIARSLGLQKQDVCNDMKNEQPLLIGQEDEDFI